MWSIEFLQGNNRMMKLGAQLRPYRSRCLNQCDASTCSATQPTVNDPKGHKNIQCKIPKQIEKFSMKMDLSDEMIINRTTVFRCWLTFLKNVKATRSLCFLLKRRQVSEPKFL